MTLWKRTRHRIEEAACKALAQGIPRLPRRAIVALARTLGEMAFTIDRRGRAVALANLECAFGEGFTPEQRAGIARRSYGNFARTMLDLFWASRMPRETFAQYFRMEGFEPLIARLESEQCGAVLMCAHQGNWEWASLACGFLGLHTTIVAEDFKNSRLTALFSHLREVSGHRIIAQEQAILRLLRAAQRGGRTGMLIDLSLRPSRAATIVTAFGMEMCVPALHGIIARRAGALLIPIETEPLSDGTCRIIAHLPVEYAPSMSAQEIAQRCWDVFERIIVARPHEYLWPYKHFRYRPKGAAVRYPFYANESLKFEKLRAGITV